MIKINGLTGFSFSIQSHTYILLKSIQWLYFSPGSKFLVASLISPSIPFIRSTFKWVLYLMIACFFLSFRLFYNSINAGNFSKGIPIGDLLCAPSNWVSIWLNCRNKRNNAKPTLTQTIKREIDEPHRKWIEYVDLVLCFFFSGSVECSR